MSETLFFPLLAAVILAGLVYLSDQKKSTFIILTLLSALLPVTRYAGALFIGMVAITIFVFSKQDIKKRIRNFLIYLFFALIPIGIWFLHLYTSFKKVGGKHFKLGLELLKNLAASFQTEFNVLKQWLPYYGIYPNPVINRILVWGILFVILIMAGFLVYSLRKKGLDSKAKHLIWISGLCLGAYLLFIAFTHSITIPQIDIMDRMLSPVYPFFVLLVIASLYFAMEAGGWQRILFYSAILAVLIVLRFNFLTTFAYVNELKNVRARLFRPPIPAIRDH